MPRAALSGGLQIVVPFVSGKIGRLRSYDNDMSVPPLPVLMVCFLSRNDLT